MYIVQCTKNMGHFYSAQRTMHNVNCTVYSAQCTSYSVQCSVYLEKFRVPSAHSTGDSTKWVFYSVKCTVKIGQ